MIQPRGDQLVRERVIAQPADCDHIEPLGPPLLQCGGSFRQLRAIFFARRGNRIRYQHDALRPRPPRLLFRPPERLLEIRRTERSSRSKLVHLDLPERLRIALINGRDLLIECRHTHRQLTPLALGEPLEQRLDGAQFRREPERPRRARIDQHDCAIDRIRQPLGHGAHARHDQVPCTERLGRGMTPALHHVVRGRGEVLVVTMLGGDPFSPDVDLEHTEFG